MERWLVFLTVFGLAAGLAGPALAADTNTLTVTASVSGNCRFNSATSTLAFGALDPSSGSDATAATSVDFWCTRGSSYSVTDNDGLYELGVDQCRVRHTVTTTEYIPYTLSYTPTSGTGNGRNSPITLEISGSILNADYVDALAGSYSDSVVLSITP